jgi:hypothetical protein
MKDLLLIYFVPRGYKTKFCKKQNHVIVKYYFILLIEDRHIAIKEKEPDINK